MKLPDHNSPLRAFHRAAARVPAYRELLGEAGIAPNYIRCLEDFVGLPVLGKSNTFARFPIERLCIDGELGQPASILTSSGHSGNFSFGLTESGAAQCIAEWIDDVLDVLFAVRSKPTLLINCLSMGVKVYTSACTLAETSVRPDMVIALLKAFARHYHQVVLVSEAAFVKHMLDVGESSRMDWKSLRMHVLLGEEPLAENARKYIEGILGIDSCQDGSPLVCSSMGIGEFGMHCFAEVPPARELIRLRRALHDDRELRSQLISHDWVPPIFTYDPQRFYVEIDDDRRLLITTLADNTRIPLIRYAPGDFASWLHLPRHLQSKIERAGVSWSLIQNLPLLLMEGRGRYADSACGRVYPEEVKEGIYLRPELAKQTTANFRLVPGLDHVRIRIQLSAGMVPSDDLNLHFETAIGEYTKTPIEVQCEAYLQFGAGMVLDYERKFDYFGN